MITVSIITIPHHEQRYDTVGDWTFIRETGALHIRVSDLNNWRYELLVGVHELVEALLCSHAGIKQEIVDTFDFNYKGDEEPGDDYKCPYSGPHCIATGVERVLAAVMGVSWSKYEKTLDNLPKWKEKNVIPNDPTSIAD
jgi:hypothetical protein